jgi:hypothetical protein
VGLAGVGKSGSAPPLPTISKHFDRVAGFAGHERRSPAAYPVTIRADDIAFVNGRAESVPANMGGESSCLRGSNRKRVSGTACETLAGIAARAVSPPVRRSCAGRLRFSPKSAIADCPAKCSGRRSTKQTRALRHSICGAGCSSLLPSSRKSREARQGATTRKDRSPIACIWNTFTHERPPFKKDCRYNFITRFSGNFEAERRFDFEERRFPRFDRRGLRGVGAARTTNPVP